MLLALKSILKNASLQKVKHISITSYRTLNWKCVRVVIKVKDDWFAAPTSRLDFKYNLIHVMERKVMGEGLFAVFFVFLSSTVEVQHRGDLFVVYLKIAFFFGDLFVFSLLV